MKTDWSTASKEQLVLAEVVFVTIEHLHSDCIVCFEKTGWFSSTVAHNVCSPECFERFFEEFIRKEVYR